nr:MAG TPA: hypothetical protein [Caudoviricetes sp.]
MSGQSWGRAFEFVRTYGGRLPGGEWPPPPRGSTRLYQMTDTVVLGDRYNYFRSVSRMFHTCYTRCEIRLTFARILQRSCKPCRHLAKTLQAHPRVCTACYR